MSAVMGPSEKNARLYPPRDENRGSETQGTADSSIPASASAPIPKKRSCVVCRSRKVRCDKLSPCSNCRRANIACVFPSTDRPPRWARRLAASNPQVSAVSQTPDPAATQVMERLRNLESLVKDLSGQLEVANAAAAANAAANSTAGGSSGVNSPGSSSHDRDTGLQKEVSPSTNTENVGLQKQFGRLVLQDANRSRYVSSGFWSRVNDELDDLKMESHGLGTYDSETSDDEASPGKSPSSTQELQRTPLERHAFLFRHSLSPSTPDLREFHPLPSQIPFLLDIFSENVNSIMRIVHVPTITKMVRDLRGSDMTSLSPPNEALMFSIYYAAITSMEEDDIKMNFGVSKTDLNLKYRLGLELALSKADFLNVPDLVLVQAFAIFLSLVRRHDSPRFVWMMTGLVIRMGQALGLQRDGAQFKNLTPYEIEMRRRAWAVLCMLDIRAAEDQGSDYTITPGSYDTKLPLNINDADIEPETNQMPTGRGGLTDMTIPIVSCEINVIVRQMMPQSAKEGAPGIEEQTRLLNEIWQKVDQGYLQYSVEANNIVYWVQINVIRLVTAKLTLFIYLPVLFSLPSEHLSDQIRNKLLVAAIEVAEYNHALNAEHEARHWRWVYQTYTHWHAVVYLLIEISRRPLSPVIERAWNALHSPWLIPPQSTMDKNQRVWVPLRKLTAKAKKHRAAEIERLKSDPQAARQLEMEDEKIPVSGSPGLFPTGASNPVAFFRERWRELLQVPGHHTKELGLAQSSTSPPTQSTYTTPPSIPAYYAGGMGSSPAFDPVYPSAYSFRTTQNQNQNQNLPTANPPSTNTSSDLTMGHTTDYRDPLTWNSGLVPWLWADADPSIDVFAGVDVDVDLDFNMDIDGGDVDWYNWVESARGMEWDAGNGQV
ncbi:Bikaverin cluster transcription factor [Lachnellula hyalina]|uniref:Bikaverin cluster transcription factor n=1 Tax=Lachnellula hyalina TaxID=1316788 RepID=A0A8H8TXN0_9HELO|nr:Bikaverin cluster transcription factor [Lachnellula hyalina]TVY25692.1 Bikaverin cluster transcription factor [Lachnellula hyalina]